jgi:capsular polysaccharide biosynthesis protein
VALALSAAAIAAVFTQRQPTTYESSVTLVVQTSAGANDTETLVRTMIALVGSEVVGEALREQVGSPLAADEITANLAVDRPPGSSVLTIYYYDTDASRSVETARAVVPVFQEQVSLLEADQAGQLAPNYAIQSWGGGAVVTTDIPAPVLRNAAIAGLLGALLGGIGAVIYQQRNPLVRSGQDAAQATHLPVLTTPRWLSGRSRTQWHPTDVVDAVIGALPAALGRTTLPRRILVVGTDSGRQRSAFVTHLARALEQDGAHPTLVDADLETGRLSRSLGLSGAK